MQIVEQPSVIVWLLAGIAALVAGYGSLLLARVWWPNNPGRAAGSTPHERPRFLDTHIATQWSEGRLRLDSLLALLRALERSLERDVQAMQQSDSSDGQSDNRADLAGRDAPGKAGPVLRRFTFDTHLRNECRTLIPLLQFCAKDLMELQGKDMTQKLAVLTQIQVAIEAAGPY